MSGQTRRAGRMAILAAFGAVIGLAGPAHAAFWQALVENQNVIVGPDGNGATSATFATKAGGEEVRYVLVVENGFSAGERRRPPVDLLQITLNGDVVFDNASSNMAIEKIEIALNAVGGDPNQLTLQAMGARGSGARVTILALQRPVQRYGGRSVVLSMFECFPKSVFLSAHNAGPSPMAVRLLFLNADGTVAGRTPVQPLGVYQKITWNFLQAAMQHGIQCQDGAVHVEWVAPGESHMTAITFTREGEGAWTSPIWYEPLVRSIGEAEFRAFWGQLPPG